MVTTGPGRASGTDWARLLPRFSLEVFSPRQPARRTDPVTLQRDELRAAGFVDFLSGADRGLTVVVNDAHRFTDTHSFLDAVFAEIDSAGLTIECRVLVAAGSHRSEADERETHELRMFGGHRPRIAQVAWHDARDAGALSKIGVFGLHPWVCGGGTVLACGSVEPHYFAGATGAHKTLTVGVMSMASLTDNHKGALSPASGGMKLAGNPVYDGVCAALAAIEAAGAKIFVVNQIVVDGKVTVAAAGDPIGALEKLIPKLREVFTLSRPSRADLVVARVSAPLDRDFYQADKGIKNTEVAVRDGGVMILEAACSKGIGIDHFVQLLREAPTHKAALAVVDRRGYRLGDHKAVKLRYLTDLRGVRLAVVSDKLDPALGGVLGAEVFARAEDAAAWADKQLATDAPQGLVINDAGNLTVEILDG